MVAANAKATITCNLTYTCDRYTLVHGILENDQVIVLGLMLFIIG